MVKQRQTRKDKRDVGKGASGGEAGGGEGGCKRGRRIQIYRKQQEHGKRFLQVLGMVVVSIIIIIIIIIIVIINIIINRLLQHTIIL